MTGRQLTRKTPASFSHQRPGRHPAIHNRLNAFNGTHQHEEVQPVGVNGSTR